MSQIIRGPFNLIYGGSTLAEISTLKVAYTVDTSDTATVQGHKKRTYGAHEVIITATFLESDVPSLAVALPQYFVPYMGVLSTGETVNDHNGAIDIVPGNTATTAGSDLIIEQAAGTSTSNVLRILDAISEISGVSVDEKSQMVEVEFTGQSDIATIQFFLKDAVTVLS